MTDTTLYRPNPKIAAVLAIIALAAAVGAVIITLRASSSKPPRTITVSGHAVRTGSPDIAYVTLGIITRAKTAKEAFSQNTLKSNNLIKALTANGAASKDIKTINYSLGEWVKYDRNYNPIRLGSEVSNSLRVTVRDLKKVSTFIDAATKAGASEVTNVKFSIENEHKLVDDALSAAVSNAKLKAKAMTKTLGACVGQPVSIKEVTNTDSYQYRIAAEKAAVPASSPMQASPQLMPGTIRAEAEAVVTFQIL